MKKYRCSICGFIYDEVNESVSFDELPESWVCPICKQQKSKFALLEETNNNKTINHETIEEYLKDYARLSDEKEVYMSDIHTMAKEGKSMI